LKFSTQRGYLSQSPTLARAGTQAGVILGTAAYMSPEQARGKPVDKRADIWAFGVVFFEMLTGRQMFTGDTVSDVLAAELKEEPAWSRLAPGTPPRIVEILRHCLRRDPRQRLHDIDVPVRGVHLGDDPAGLVADCLPRRPTLSPHPPGGTLGVRPHFHGGRGEELLIRSRKSGGAPRQPGDQTFK